MKPGQDARIEAFIEWNPIGWNDLMRSPSLGDDEHKLPGSYFSKSDDPLLISTTAVWRAIMGKANWMFANLANPAFGALPKVPWDKSGERIITVEPTTAACQGVAEDGALPDSQKPTWAYHATQFKQIVTRIQVSRKMQRAAQLGDDTIDMETLKNWAFKHNAYEMGKMILEKAETAAGAAAADYAGKDGLEALDRAISCDAEEDDLGGTHDGYYDPWTKYESTAGGTVWDRDSGTTYDAQVIHGDGTLCYQTGNPAFGTDATLSLETIDQLIDETQKNGANPRSQVFITGFDTARRWAQLVSPKQRFADYERMTVTVNGVEAVEGRRAGFRVGMYDDIPILRDKNCPKDTISKIFLVDTSSLFLKVATPTFLMAPDEAESYLASDKLQQDYWFLTELELWNTDPTVQGKLVSLK